MRTVLHIGMPKTGTTALQSCFQESYRILLDRGVLYPDSGPDIRFNRHIMLIQPLLEFDRRPRSLKQQGAQAEDLERWHDTFVQSVRSEIVAERPRCLVLSAESLARAFKPDEMARLADQLEGLGVGEMAVAAYLRRPSSSFLSSAQQKLKASHRLKQPSVASYRGMLEAYSDQFGAENVHPRVFDRSSLLNGDIVADFCASHLGGEDVDPRALKRGERSNESMSAEAMEIVLRYRGDFDSDNEDMFTSGSRLLRRAIAQAEARIGVPRPRLKDEVADAIDYSSPDILWLRDTYGIEFPGLDYARLEAGTTPIPDRKYSIGDLVEIDPEVRARLLDELARSRWAKTGEHRQWLSGLMKETA